MCFCLHINFSFVFMKNRANIYLSFSAGVQVLEKSVRMLFSSRDVSLVRKYVEHECGKVLAGRGNLQEYTFAKEYRGKEYYRPGACVPALELAK